MQPDGYTLRQHMESAARQRGRRSSRLAGPALPDGMRYLWNIFREVAIGRTYTATGHALLPNAVSALELRAWCELEGVKLTRYELACIRSLDQAYLGSCYEQHRRQIRKGRR